MKACVYIHNNIIPPYSILHLKKPNLFIIKIIFLILKFYITGQSIFHQELL